MRSPCHFLFFRLDLRLDLCNHFRELFFAFLSRLGVNIMAFPLAVGVGRRVSAFIQMIVYHGGTTSPRPAYFGRVRLEFDRGGIFPFLLRYRRHTGVCAADFAVYPHCRLSLHSIGDMAVNIKRGTYIDVSEKLLHILWCGPCKSELPAFDTLYEKYGDEVVFMIINLTDGYNDTVSGVKEFVSDGGTVPVAEKKRMTPSVCVRNPKNKLPIQTLKAIAIVCSTTRKSNINIRYRNKI